MAEEQNAAPEYREQVHAVVAAMAPRAPKTLPELTDDTVLVADLAYDSVRLIELSMALERHFELPAIEESAVATVTTVGDVVDLVTRYGREGARA